MLACSSFFSNYLNLTRKLQKELLATPEHTSIVKNNIREMKNIVTAY